MELCGIFRFYVAVVHNDYKSDRVLIYTRG